ncbi:septation protein SepH [Corynebacterium casei]|uniref:septation protein SepH n=1 Tax=Corynebacterium casei TaxID=160386 RepID=UPI001867EDE3|nr:septation protein SepH [Corynebacterium casei]
MRELFVNYSDSTKTSLVLETEEGDEFFVAVTEELQSLLDDSSDSGSHNGLSSISHLAPAAVSDDPDGDDAEDAEADFVASDEEATASNVSELAAEEGSTEDEVEQTDKADAPSAASAPVHHGPRMVSHVSSEQGSRPYSDAMTMRPAEIQARVRAGASAAELADEMGIAESRVEPFAYPVMLERNNIAEQAKQAHPVREDGPAKLTLWEILATSFAARGHSLSDAEWTAYREQSQPWVIKVSWKAGLSENEALWTFKPSMSSPSTAEARNSVAADLTDPDFVQPVRTLTSIGRGSRYDEAIDGPASADGRPRLAPVGEEYDDAELHERDDDTPGVYDQEADTSDLDPEDLEGTLAEDAPAAGNGADHGEESAESDADEFLQHPDPEKQPTKRRRKAVTPHWEDVLLGVRANTKRPRS